MIHFQKDDLKIVRCLIENGPLPVTEIAKKIGFKRSNTYAVLKRLSDNKLLQEIIKDSKKHYKAYDKDYYAFLIDSKIETEAKALNFVKKYIQDMFLHTSFDEEASVTVYHGAEDVIKAYKNFISNCRDPEIKVFVNFVEIHPKIEKYLIDQFVIERVKNGIVSKVIFTKESLSNKSVAKFIDKSELRERKIIQEHIDFDNHIVINNGITLFYLGTKSSPKLIEIRSHDVAISLSSIHEMLWKAL